MVMGIAMKMNVVMTMTIFVLIVVVKISGSIENHMGRKGYSQN